MNTEEKKVPITKLRQRILNNRGIVFDKHTKTPVPLSDLPDEYPKTSKMKYFESKYSCKIERVILSGSLTDAVLFFNFEVDRSTISRWRKHIFRHLGIVEVINERTADSG